MPAITATTGLEMRRKTAWPGVLSTKLPSDQGPRRGSGRGCGGSTGGLASICSTVLEEPVAFQELRFTPARSQAPELHQGRILCLVICGAERGVVYFVVHVPGG
ncbi:hypothetical protein CPLU01_07560 [Colletotrichum plurivorum]|uniref:Uncharacterized protein n=1 Tax=Colletotrichum plurivorum TaxID=2175906 RepID=A0A8H6KEL2_9PEZI|nr:hypothetical protein CPLU01_07560 [Colletotrichum plurivorum]